MKRIYKINMVLGLVLTAVFFAYLAHIFSTDNYMGTDDMEKEIKAQVTLYIKPSCMFCVRAKGFLKDMNVKYNEVDISNDKTKHQDLISQTGSKTVPYIFINDTYIGGCTDMLKMAEDGSLEKMLIM